LIESVARDERGTRRYHAQDMEWIELLQRLRATGMPIREVRQFAELRRGGTTTIDARRRLPARHRRRVADHPGGQPQLSRRAG
jgi:DNA-binding transcriptional MerR regulator